MKSLISNEPWCLICGDPRVHKHHIFYGTANRKKSEQYGCWCYLCVRHHLDGRVGVHYNARLNLELRQRCQKEWEKVYGGRDEFREVFGHNYLDPGEDAEP